MWRAFGSVRPACSCPLRVLERCGEFVAGAHNKQVPHKIAWNSRIQNSKSIESWERHGAPVLVHEVVRLRDEDVLVLLVFLQHTNKAEKIEAARGRNEQ